MADTMKKSAVKFAAIGFTCAMMVGGTFAVPAAAATTEELESEAIQLMDELVEYAGEDYEAFSALYVDADEELINNDFNGDWSAYTGKDQHFATLVSSSGDYYFFDVTAAICSGTYPNTHYETSDYEFLMVETDEGLKISNSQDGWNQINQGYMDVVIPEGLANAINNGTNAAEFDHYIRWFCNEDHVVDGPVDAKVKYMWQDEDGTLHLAMLFFNGTNDNRTFDSVRVELTDENLGTIWSGTLDGHSLMSGKNKMFIYDIAASDVLTGTQQ